MASTISETLELTLQDDDDFISILKTAENFEKIDNAFKDLYERGYNKRTNKKTAQITDLNSATNNGLFCGYDVAHCPFAGAVDIKVSYDQIAPPSSFIIQEVTECKTGCVAKRIGDFSTWGEWEYVNPEMILNDGKEGINPEYRTIERWLGKPVYTTMLDFEWKSSDLIDFSERDITVLRFSGTVGGCATLSCFGREGCCDISFRILSDGRRALCMYGGEDYDGVKTYVQIWYIKDDE